MHPAHGRDAAPTAYGLALPDLRGAAHLLLAGRGDELPWRVERPGAVDGAVDGAVEPRDLPELPDGVAAAVDEDRAVLGLPGGGRVVIDRRRATTTLLSPSPVSDAEVVHPHLASTAVTVAHWQGRLALHAAAIVAGGRAWALLGDRGAGKSTALFSLVRAGYAPVTDDVLVLDGLRVLPGPRCVDLRQASAEHFGAGDDLGVVGRRQRWRVTLDGAGGTSAPPDADVELAGFVHLAWGDELEVADVPLQRRWPALLDALALRLPPADQAGLLRLLSLPTVELRRPRRLDDVDRVAQTLGRRLERLSARGPAPARPATRAAAG